MRERERERSAQSSVLYKCWREEHKRWRCQERTATEDTAQSALWSCRCLLGYIRSCSQLSNSTTGWGPVEHTFTLERVTGWGCSSLSWRPLFVECVVTVCVLFVYLSKCLAPGRGEGWQSDMEIQTSMRPELAWQWLALDDVWKPRRRTWILEGGGQICSPPRQR